MCVLPRELRRQSGGELGDTVCATSTLICGAAAHHVCVYT